MAVVDGAAVPALRGRLRVGAGSRSLFEAPADRELAAAAPYLLPWSSSISDELMPVLAGSPWGILIQTTAGLEAIRTHLRRFLSVRSPSGEVWYFRYYDPRVMPPFIKACNRAELVRFFGEVRSFGCQEGDGTIHVLRFDPEVHETARARLRVGRLLGLGPIESVDPGRNSKLFELRAPHVAAFSDRAEQTLRERVANHLRRRHSAAITELTDEQLQARVVAGLARARRLGAVGEHALTAVVGLMFTVAPNFDEHPVIRRLITEGDESVDERILRLEHRTTLRNWEEARAGADPAAWARPTSGL